MKWVNRRKLVPLCENAINKLVLNTKIATKLPFSMKISKPKSKKAEKPSFGQKTEN